MNNNLLYSIKTLTDTINNHDNYTPYKEFLKRYEQTFIYIIDELKQLQLTLYFTQFDDDFQSLIGNIFTPDISNHTKIKLNNPWLYIKRPSLTKGFYYNNTNQNIYYICHIPKRQWKRGISIDNYQIFKIENNNPFVFILKNNALTKKHIIHTCLNQQDYEEISIKTIINHFLDYHNHTLFIDKNFFILRHPYKECYFYLFFHNYIIAEFTTPDKLININKIFSTELNLLPKSWIWTK